MWVENNQFLKKAIPPAHAFLKRHLAQWRLGTDPLVPAPRRIRGEFFWVHPRLLTAETRDSEPYVYEWILDHIRPGSVLFDVGAHYGWLSLKAARRVGHTGRVVAFEPSPVLLDMLKYHQARNRLSQMTVVGSAVSETDSAAASFFLLNGGLSARNSLTIGREGLPFLDSVDKTAAKVPTVRLDTFSEAEALAPDVIKIDVEGAEGMVLRGAAVTLARFHPVLVVSIHPFWLPAPESTETILDFTARYGYRARDSRVVNVEGYRMGDYLLTV
jgi:FkbM family methyltransferase